MKNTIAPNLNYRPAIFAGAMGMMATDYGGEPKQSEREELQRIRTTGHVFRAYVTEGDGLRKAAQDRGAVYVVSGANADKQSAQFRELTAEFLTTCP
jgi:chromosome partitioning protein